MTLFKTKAARTAGYIAFGVLAFVLSLYLTFPGQAVGQRISYEIERATGGAVTADVSRASLSFPLGVSAQDIRVRIPQDDGDDIQFTLDSARGGLDLWSLFTFSLRPRGTVRLGAGSISAAYSEGDIDASVDGLDLMKPLVLPKFTGLSISGKLSGDTALLMDNDPKKSSGSVRVVLDQASVGPGDAAGFSLPEALGLGKIELHLDF
ncbi:MAG: type II secretion system protein GspN, partial [Myxococcota bacterium]